VKTLIVKSEEATTIFDVNFGGWRNKPSEEA
jgi:hypothetical protein